MTELPADCTLKQPLFLSKTLPKGIHEAYFTVTKNYMQTIHRYMNIKTATSALKNLEDAKMNHMK